MWAQNSSPSASLRQFVPVDLPKDPRGLKEVFYKLSRESLASRISAPQKINFDASSSDCETEAPRL
jgi:hypothetical protein